MKSLQSTGLLFAAILAFAACKKNSDPIIIIPPSTGSTLQLSGITAANEAGSAAGNSVYVDLSTDKATVVARRSWDLGFYMGADFRVILNNTTLATAKVIAKNDLNQVVTADTAGFSTQLLYASAATSTLALIDNIQGDLNGTVIAAVSATDADNKVYIISPETVSNPNPANPGGFSARGLYKIRILRKGSGYTLQYAKLSETTFKSIDITKDADYNFQYVSLDNGVVQVQPAKAQWDFVWSYTGYQTGSPAVPYPFSDLIALNDMAGVTSAMKQYADETTTTAAFTAFNKDSVAKTTMVTGRWNMASNWRSTSPATGAFKDRFFIIKDPAGNYYKVRCLAMGSNDGGTRGKPEFKYELIK